MTGGKPTLNTRLRYESAEQEGKEDADALTLRARLGYATAEYRGFDAFVEFEGTFAIGGDEEYNSGPPSLDATNGHTAFATIADPTSEELNQAYLRYRIENATAIVGRQRIILDNARFIGNVGWRQNEQTYDALNLSNTWFEDTKMTYVYVDEAHGIFFQDRDMSSHLFNTQYTGFENLTLTGYAYLLDFETEADSRTLGLRAAGTFSQLGYTLEYARQDDYADAPDGQESDYFLIDFSMPIGVVVAGAGYESLGGDGTYAFMTPLATAHAFQGWADLFLATPADGVQDLYAVVGTKLGKTLLKAVYHDFSADNGGADYGDEIDLLAVYPVNEKFKLLAKFADYSKDTFGVDTRRLWLQAEYAF